MSKPPAWSFSSLTAYETCPHRYFRNRVIKDICEPESESMRWGNEVHKALEDRVRDGVPLPAAMQKWEPLVAKLLARKGKVIAEQQLCLNEQLVATDWFGSDAWCRGIVDFMLIDGSKAMALDWKTGKVKNNHDQLMLFAALIFHHYPEVDVVHTGYVWLAQGNKITTNKFRRSELSDIWEDLLPRVRRLELAFEKSKWEKKPSGLCRAWCPVHDCEFNGKNK